MSSTLNHTLLYFRRLQKLLVFCAVLVFTGCGSYLAASHASSIDLGLLPSITMRSTVGFYFSFSRVLPTAAVPNFPQSLANSQRLCNMCCKLSTIYIAFWNEP